MDIKERTTERRVVKIEGIDFYVEELANPLGWLRRGSVKDSLVDSAVLHRMKEAGLVQKTTTGGLMSLSDDEPVTKWEPVDDKCSELYEDLTVSYCRLRPKLDTGTSGFGMWDEIEDKNAREKAEEKVTELNERNPDVEFYLDEEQLNTFQFESE